MAETMLAVVQRSPRPTEREFIGLSGSAETTVLSSSFG